MKICPRCSQTYGDVSLNFCLADGAVLEMMAGLTNNSVSTLVLKTPVSTDSNLPFYTEGDAQPSETFTVVNARIRPEKTYFRAWVIGGIVSLLAGVIFAFYLVYFVFLRDTSYEVTVKAAPVGSTIQVDGSPIAVMDENGSFRLMNITAGQHVITIVNPGFMCEKRIVTGGKGMSPEPIIARCTALTAISTDNCGDIRFGEDDKAELCYNSALDALNAMSTSDASGNRKDNFTVEQLVKALNILNINFESKKWDIPPVRLAALQKGAGLIKRLPPGVILEVGCHTDSVGQPAANQSLSEARANAVKAALVKFGVADSMLVTRGYGATKPIATNDTADGKLRNGRIEYSIVK